MECSLLFHLLHFIEFQFMLLYYISTYSTYFVSLHDHHIPQMTMLSVCHMMSTFCTHIIFRVSIQQRYEHHLSLIVVSCEQTATFHIHNNESVFCKILSILTKSILCFFFIFFFSLALPHKFKLLENRRSKKTMALGGATKMARW